MLTFLRLLPVGAQIGIAIAVLVAGGGGYVAWRSGVFNKGVAYERAQQKERDDEAVGEALEGVRDVDACYAARGVWDVKTGQCRQW